MFKLYLYSLSSLYVIVILSSSAIHHQTVAFVPHDLCLDCSNSFSFKFSESSLKVTPPGIGDAHENQDGGDDDDDFYRDLRRAKHDMLGRSIPPEQARKSAVQAESDFLRAMRETKVEFEKAKEDLGPDGAVDLFIDRIREEDERNDDEAS
jgi:hypothetical protein